MTDHDNLADLLQAALATAKLAEEEAAKAKNSPDARSAAVTIEQVAIDIASVFEALMQHHFKRGPFYKELQKRMNADDQSDLGERVIQYAHAVNVLKHGHGKSHRELLNMKRLPFRVRRHDRNDTDIGLVDVLSPEFSDGLIETLTLAKAFLER